MPKRPLSAYNIFFRKERQVLLGEDLALEFEITDQTRRKHRKTHGKIGFAEMAKLVGQRWKKLDTTTKQGFEEQANGEKERYVEHLEVWKKAQEEDPTEEPTETTECMGDEPIISQADRGIMRPTPMEASLPKPQALPQAETAHFPTIFQREEDYTNEPRFHGRNAYLPTMNASLPGNFGGNAPISTILGRASLPGNLPSHYGDSTPYPRAQHFENERLREMEEMYRMHLAEAAILRERLSQRRDTGTTIDYPRQQPSAYPSLMRMQARRASSAPRDMMDTGTTIDHLRQQPSAYPGLMQIQARRASSAPRDMMDTGTTIDHLRQQLSAYPSLSQTQARRGSDSPGDTMGMDRGQAHMADLLIIERAQAARQAYMIALQRVLDNQRVLREEEELRKRRGL
jgi:hypothetical protein